MPGHRPPSSQYQGLYRAAVDEAVVGGSVLMGKLVAAAGLVLRAREKASLDLRERDAFAASAQRLQREEVQLRAQYPKSLLEAFSNPEQFQRSMHLAAPSLDFDQLELMDELQVEESVAIARVQQSALLATDASLAELNTLMCSALGLETVCPERNPLRPQVYINALKDALDRVQAPESMRLDWFVSMGAALGKELSERYLHVSAQLRSHGVASVGYAVLQTPGSGGVTVTASNDVEPSKSVSTTSHRRSDGLGVRVGESQSVPVVDRRGTISASSGYQGRAIAPMAAGDDALLTLDKLRKLLTGELNQFHCSEKVEAFADQFFREFESGSVPVEVQPTEFDATVPAALDALKEMQQLDHVVHRLEQRKAMRHGRPASVIPADSAVHVALQGQVKDVAQALSVEVVKLMVENIARDRRLLEPVQQVIRELEPALARLSLVDRRMFTNKQHPARVLVHEVAHNSMAYASTPATGFAEFLAGVQKALNPLMHGTIENAEPFERALGSLRDGWKITAKINTRDRARAVKILEHAEQRNVLAEKIARQIAAHRDASEVPALVVDFLCGPWAQVVAQARIVSGVGSVVADRYQALVAALFWSTHPQLTQNNIPKLTRLVPPLLATLREGLETIHYSPVKASAFIESLMGLHQQVFQSHQKPREAVVQALDVIEKGGRSVLIEEGNPWVAPDEARASNFMDLPAQSEDADALPHAAGVPETEAVATSNADTQAFLAHAGSDVNVLSVGSWVELRVGGEWVRTQLTWASPHGSLFLFTSALGATQSMTRRSRDKLVASGNLRVISGQPVVDGALDAVAQQAMRNSLGMRSA